MKRAFVLLAAGLLVAWPGVSSAQAPPEAMPEGAPPSTPPPPPESPQPPPEAVEAAPPSPADTQSGQWVYTSQYGWVWMPYGNQYVYTPQSGEPFVYLYYPAIGWQWVVAPWLGGLGPRPFFGRRGPWHYSWYRAWRGNRFRLPFRAYPGRGLAPAPVFRGRSRPRPLYRAPVNRRFARPSPAFRSRGARPATRPLGRSSTMSRRPQAPRVGAAPSRRAPQAAPSPAHPATQRRRR